MQSRPATAHSVSCVGIWKTMSSEDETLRMHQHASISASIWACSSQQRSLRGTFADQTTQTAFLSQGQQPSEETRSPDGPGTFRTSAGPERNSRSGCRSLEDDFLRWNLEVVSVQPRFPTVPRLLGVLWLKIHLRLNLSKTDDFSAPRKHIWRRSGDGVGAAESRGRRSG